MADLFAFAVALPSSEAEQDDLGFYDPDTQQFVWAGGGEIELGSALCTHGPAGWHHCTSSGSTCQKTGKKDCYNPFNLCYAACDYG